jgi:hypothetical protein
MSRLVVGEFLTRRAAATSKVASSANFESMGLFGKVRAYKSGWGEITGPLPAWMKSNGVVDLGSETILSASLAPHTRVDLIESRRDRNWKLVVESWVEGGTVHQGSAQVVGRPSTPPLLLRAAFVRACLRGLEDFEKFYEGSIVGPEVYRRIHEIKASGLL